MDDSELLVPIYKDIFKKIGFYTRAAAELLSQDEDFLDIFYQSMDLTEEIHGVAKENSLTKYGNNLKQNSEITGSAPLFSDAIGSQLSDFKKDRLKSLVRQSLFTFTQEVDQVLTPVLNICRIQSVLRCKESKANEANEEHNPQKKHNVSASSVMDDDMQFLLKNDKTKVEEIMKKHSDELFATIGHMEQKLEEFLDLLMSSCRLMTLTEKQQLLRLIRNLPPKNLDRVVEIIQRSRALVTYPCDAIHVDLEGENKVTLWRLYYYVEAVENARKLCEVR